MKQEFFLLWGLQARKGRQTVKTKLQMWYIQGGSKDYYTNK